MTAPSPSALQRLAERCGIEPAYDDIWGRRHVTSAETQRALLAAMDVAAADEAQAQASLDALELADWRRVLPPVRVLREDEAAPRLALAMTPAMAAATWRWRLVAEDGRETAGEVLPECLAIEAAREVDGATRTRYLWPLPAPLPPGYHRLELGSPAGETSALQLIVAPARCHQPPALADGGRAWGLAAQLYALRSPGNWGIGDYTDLRHLVGCAAEHGAAIVALNPLHALFPHRPEQSSPYSPSSRLFLNVLYIDVEAVADLAECEAARAAIDAPAFQERLLLLRQAELVDYAGVAAVKLAVLDQLYRSFRERHLAQGGERAEAFRRFQREEGEALRRHALYEALQERFYREDPTVWGWPVWPQDYRAPDAPAVARYAAEHVERVEFYEYLQWLADEQLARAAERARQFELAVGLYQDLAVSIDRSGAEAWASQGLYARDASIGAPPDDFALGGQDWGLPPLIPHRLTQSGYAPFIATLRRAMRHAGALRMDHVMGLMRLFWVPPGRPASEGAYVRYPLADLLGILALESMRNRCLVIGEDLGTVPDAVREALRPLGVLSYRLFYYERDREARFLPPGRWPAQALAAATTQDLPTLAGWWAGRDIAVRRELGLFPDEEAPRQQAWARGEDRVRLLRLLAEQGLLPEGIGSDPDALPRFPLALAAAVHRHLARTPSQVMLVQLEDLTGQLDQVNLPGTTDQYPNWRRKLPLVLADLFSDPEAGRLAQALNAERGAGARAPRAEEDGTHEGSAVIPRATYRLQFNAGFTFADAAALAPYLAELGVSHCYASPYLKARAGSTHGYDIVDHGALNPEIGDAADYERYTAALRAHGLGQVLDIVPNHMGVGGNDNQWWMDVLENGPASIYAPFFDIDWRPIKEELRGKVLLPVLGEHYGTVLEQGAIALRFEPDTGAIAAFYYEHRFPLDPGSYPAILGHHLQRLEAALGTADADLIELQSLITAFEHLPASDETREERLRERNRDKEVHKKRLGELYRRRDEIARYIEGNLTAYNGSPGEPASFELLHALLERQPWRLASWRVATDEINYRRFFDVNALAGLRMERPEVFHATHKLVLDLIGKGRLDGLRIDHPDGLYDPVQYYERLQGAAAVKTPRPAQAAACGEAGERTMPLYVLVEKILAAHEHLPNDWPVHGTTGYEFMNLANGLLVWGESERYLDAIYARFIGGRLDFDEIVFQRKRLIMKVALNSELAVLASLLNAISESDRHTRDFTLAGLRAALMDVVACFPVYRSYVTGKRVTAEDRRYIDWAVAQAKRRSTAADTSIFDFIRGVLLLEAAEGRGPEYREAVTRFAMKFQQYTAPVMAKGVEDTSFYVYNRLASLNEVGGDPRRYGVSLAAFHRANEERARFWPHTLLATSTHDNKRSEDVRARISVLSEIPDEWRQRLVRWRRSNRTLRQEVNGQAAPAANDEYLFYQTLVGAWPIAEPDEAALAALRERIEAYMLKAVREAKVHTSWINPNARYEQALAGFVRGALSWRENNLFLQDFAPFARRVARYGMYGSLTQTVLKFTVPGVPDIYQGNELWDLSLVDPDNRRPVDYARRRETLQALDRDMAVPEDMLAERARGLVDAIEDGRIKLYLTWRLLQLRRQHPQLFRHGDYQALEAAGTRAEHLCAFARAHGSLTLVVVAPRWFARLCRKDSRAPLGADAWADTWVRAPIGQGGRYRNVLTGETPGVEERDAAPWFAAQALMSRFPLAVLLGG